MHYWRILDCLFHISNARCKRQSMYVWACGIVSRVFFIRLRCCDFTVSSCIRIIFRCSRSASGMLEFCAMFQLDIVGFSVHSRMTSFHRTFNFRSSSLFIKTERECRLCRIYGFDETSKFATINDNDFVIIYWNFTRPCVFIIFATRCQLMYKFLENISFL